MNIHSRRVLSSRGVSIVEVVIASALLLVGLLSLVATVLQNYHLDETSRETMLATNAARTQLEQILETDVDDVYATYKPGGTMGDTFSVPGLLPVEQGIPAGRITLLIDETAIDPRFGLPMDLNSDGIADSTDVSANFTLLPIVVTVTWLSGMDGRQRSYEVNYVLHNDP